MSNLGFRDAAKGAVYPLLGTTCYCFPRAICLDSTEMYWILRSSQVLKLSTNVRGMMKT